VSDIFRDYSFGGWLSNFRMEQGITLREMAIKLGMDAGNLSKLERSELPPPKKAKRIVEICVALGKPDAVELLKSIAFQHHLSMLQKEFYGEALG
jgi:transcriptional regulator with XRE-family HTH domain